LWRFSLPAVLSGTMVGPVYWVCSALLVHRPDGYAQMGLWNAANQWFAVMLFLPAVLGQAVFPMLSEALGRGDLKGSRRLLLVSMKLNALIVLPLVAGVCAASPLIMASYGSGFASAWPTLCLVAVTGGLLAIQTPIGQVMAASGRMWLGALMNAGWAAVFLATTLGFLHLGASGVAAGRLVAYGCHAIWTFWFAWVVLGRVQPAPAMSDASPGV
jgi:O-antigen/teichoic acid export membrane protein